ncbi:MAG: PAS domain-containing sensor histidine kinase [Chitinophagaceae bacterium]
MHIHIQLSMYKADPKLIIWLCLIATISIAILKLWNTSFLFFNTGLILIVLLTVLIQNDVYTYLFGTLAILIIIVSPYISTPDVTQRPISSQLLAGAMATLAMLLVLYIKRLQRSIEGERLQLNSIFKFANEGIILTNDQSEIVLINPNATRLFLVEEDNIIGKPISELFPEVSVDTDSLPNPLLAFYRDPSSWKLENQLVMNASKSNGTHFPVEIKISYYKERKKSFVLIFLNDVSERKEYINKMVLQKEQLEKITSDVRILNVELENKVAERTLILQEALKELEKSQTELNDALNEEKGLNEIKSRFISMASHEFRTPLSTILSSASLLLKYNRTEENTQREKHIRRIKDSVKHLTGMLEDFLDLGKLDSGKVSRDIDFFDVKDFFQDVVDEMEATLKNGQEVRLSMEGESNFATDKRLLKNVLINILNNASKFSADEQPIDVKIFNSGYKLSLQIHDQGIGIPAEDMPYLFTSFYRGRNALNINGTGLGLHIVKRYINILEGNITITSKLNEGTSCNIELPSLKEPN